MAIPVVSLEDEGSFICRAENSEEVVDSSIEVQVDFQWLFSPSVCLFVFLSIYLSVCPSICLYVCLSVYLSLSLSLFKRNILRLYIYRSKFCHLCCKSRQNKFRHLRKTTFCWSVKERGIQSLLLNGTKMEISSLKVIIFR